MKHGGFQHQALIYDGTVEYVAGTIPFLMSALEAGEPALVAVGPEQAELLAAELGEDRKHVRFADMRAFGRNPAWIIPFWREFVEEQGGGPVRGIGEPIWPERSRAALEESQRHEALLNLAFAGAGGLSLLCPYDARALPEEVLEQAGASHPLLACAGEVRESRSYQPSPDCFAGELPPPQGEVSSLRFGLDELALVRRVVGAAAAEAGHEGVEAADFVTAASELAANSVMHGGGGGVLRVWREGGSFLAEIEDRGRIEEPLVGRLRPGLEQAGGRGLWLANQLCDLVQIRSGDAGTVVRLHLGARDPLLV